MFGGFGWGGSWFGVLTCEASDSGDGGAEAVDEDEGHLEEDFEFIGDVFWTAVVEGFGAVSSLKDEALSELGLGDLGFEAFDFPGSDEGGELGEARGGGVECGGVGVGVGWGEGGGLPGVW